MGQKLSSWFKDNYRGIIITCLAVVPLIVSLISTVHVVNFFKLSNFEWLAITLAIAFEIGALSSLAALAVMDKINKYSLWAIFILITLMQMMGNTYYAFDFIATKIKVNPEWTQNWIDLFAIQGSDLPATQRILAIVSGAFLPVISLTFLHMLISYISATKDQENVEYEYVTVDEDGNEIVSEEIVVESEGKKKPQTKIDLIPENHDSIPNIDSANNDDNINTTIENKDTAVGIKENEVPVIVSHEEVPEIPIKDIVRENNTPTNTNPTPTKPREVKLDENSLKEILESFEGLMKVDENGKKTLDLSSLLPIKLNQPKVQTALKPEEEIKKIVKPVINPSETIIKEKIETSIVEPIEQIIEEDDKIELDYELNQDLVSYDFNPEDFKTDENGKWVNIVLDEEVNEEHVEEIEPEVIVPVIEEENLDGPYEQGLEAIKNIEQQKRKILLYKEKKN